MTAANASRSGNINIVGGDDRALFLKQFSGEILRTFHQVNQTRDKHIIRQMKNGKSAQFPVVGQVEAAYHTPGEEILGDQVPHNERVIVIDDQLVAPIFVPEVDDMINHYDVRSAYAEEAGIELATEWDVHVLQKVIQGARASATLTGGDGGFVSTLAGYANDGAVIASGLFLGAQSLDEHNVMNNDRYAFFRPAQYYLLAQTTNVINRDWGGQGAYAEGTVLKVAGIHIEKSNNVPSTNVTTGPNTYRADYSNTQGVIFHKSAVGTAKLMDMRMRMDYDERRLGTLIVAKFLMGTEFLRPESSVELASA